MDSKIEDLTKQSLEIENDFSSSNHAVECLSNEKIIKKSIYEIPNKYNKNSLRIIPINISLYYIYWEVCDFTLQNHNIDLNFDKLTFEVNDNSNKTKVSFESSYALGEYYLKREFEDMDICVKTVVYKNNQRIELFSSNMIHTFSSKIKLPSKDDEIWIKKKEYWSKLLEASYNDSDLAMSSDKYVKELEQLVKRALIEENHVNSQTLTKEII